MSSLPTGLKLRGQNVVLRDFTENDVDAIVALFDDVETRRWYPFPLTGDAFEEDPYGAARTFVERTRLRRLEGKLLRLAITTDGSDVKGEVAFSPETSTLGYAVAAEHRRMGLASQSLRALLDYVRRELEATMALAEIDAENVASCRLVESLGFRLVKTEAVEDDSVMINLQTWSLNLTQ